MAGWRSIESQAAEKLIVGGEGRSKEMAEKNANLIKYKLILEISIVILIFFFKSAISRSFISHKICCINEFLISDFVSPREIFFLDSC